MVKAVAPEAGHHRLDHRQRHSGPYRRIYCVSAITHYHQPGLGGQGMVCRRRAALTDDEGPVATGFIGRRSACHNGLVAITVLLP